MFNITQKLSQTIGTLDLPNCYAIIHKCISNTYYKDSNRLGKRKASTLGANFKKYVKDNT